MILEDAILTFPEPLVGFPELKTFRILEPSDAYPIKFLQAVEREDISFVCMDVAAFKPDYVVPFSEADAQALGLEDPADALILALLVVPENPRDMTANLAGPLVVNIKTRQARQIILNIDKYPLKHRVFPAS